MFRKKSDSERISAERKTSPNAREIPLLAKDVIERGNFIGPNEVPEELPSLDSKGNKSINRKPASEKLMAKQDLNFNPDEEIHHLKGRVERVERLLKSAKKEHYLHLHDGRIIKNIHDLRASLVGMSSDTFNHHVNFERNDFADWVRTVFGEQELAERLSSATSRAQMIRIFNEFFD